MIGDEEVSVFFYGGLINPDVQETVGLLFHSPVNAVLYGYALTFEPWVNLCRSEESLVYGVVAKVSHPVLASVYGALPARYDPYPVFCEAADGTVRNALCYIASNMPAGPIDNRHVMNLVEGAAARGFSARYVAMIRGFCREDTRPT